jgi:hypothetical protein
MATMTRPGDSPSILRKSKPLLAVIGIYAYLKTVSTVPDTKTLPTELCAWVLIWLLAKLGIIGSRAIESKDFNRNWTSLIAICVILAFACERYAPVETVAPLLAPLLLLLPHIHHGYSGTKTLSLSNIYQAASNSVDITFILFSAVATVLLVQNVEYGASSIVATIHLAVMALILDNKSHPTHSEDTEDEEQQPVGQTGIRKGAENSVIEQISVRTAALLILCMAVSPPQTLFQPWAFFTVILTRAAFWAALLDLVSTPLHQ